MMIVQNCAMKGIPRESHWRQRALSSTPETACVRAKASTEQTDCHNIHTSKQSRAKQPPEMRDLPLADIGDSNDVLDHHT